MNASLQRINNYQWRTLCGHHQELPWATLANYPLLAAVEEAWRAEKAALGRLPVRLDPLKLPKSVLPYVMLLDLENAAGEPDAQPRVAGSEVCAKHGREMRGLTTDDFFRPDDAGAVVQSAMAIARSGEPSLAKRSYITLGDSSWSYVRLILPLSRTGERIDSFFKVADPESMNHKVDWDQLNASFR